MNKKIALLLMFAACSTVFSIDTAAARYLPLQIGNTWVYTFTEHPSGYSHTLRWTITGTSILNNHEYYSLDEYGAYGAFTSYIRFDSAAGSLKKYSNSPCSWLLNEVNMDSLSSRLGDSSTYNCDIRYKCNDTSNINYFNLVFKRKGFYANYDYGYRTRTFAKNVGLVTTFTAGMTGTYSTVLNGCLVNGVLYGDTSLVGIHLINAKIPSEFSLAQNYPNPFNPNTHIGFRIADFGFVRVTVFDVLGKEVQTLVNQELSLGTYDVDFNGTNLPSGVYYYVLEAGSFSETKRMVLIK
ncbi:MAG: T9SS type A sorting domain-containing protein [Ignavibacteria bacterium]|nr:T9SS type A sorting domain-containing protein [Ignavibacteria bacterium]